MAISNQKFIDSAKLLGVDIAVIKAVAKVEGGGAGIVEGKPVILFEPHIFYKLQKQATGINPVISDICYPVWGSKAYPKGQAAQWERLDRASKINRPLALKSASWGMFQILGLNFKQCACSTIQVFVNDMYESEDTQLALFLQYVVNNNLADELQNKDWKGFARQYNGLYYYRNNYDVKLKNAYLSFT